MDELSGWRPPTALSSALSSLRDGIRNFYPWYAGEGGLDRELRLARTLIEANQYARDDHKL